MLKRIGIYLREMFPINVILGNIFTAITIEFVYLALYDVHPGLAPRLIFPAIVLTLVALLIRVMDEFKDYQDDLANFPGRPLPSGRVRHKDLQILGAFCVVMIIYLSSTSKPVLIWSLITLFYTFLMLKWFFIENAMRKNLPLAFITHHPIVLFNFIYLILVCQEFYPQVGWEKSWMILPLCLMFTNWEVSRKIRTPEQETGYTTYSKILGPKKAIVICLCLQIIVFATAQVIFYELQSPWPIAVAYSVLQWVLTRPYVRFLFTLKLKGPLKMQAEHQILLVIGSLLLAVIL